MSSTLRRASASRAGGQSETLLPYVGGLLRPASGALGWVVCVCLFVVLFSATTRAEELPSPKSSGDVTPAGLDKTWGVGPWIWGPETHDKQTCLLWRTFDIPSGSKVKTALLRISVDNGYRLMLDGREIGAGSDWRSITEYDLGQLLQTGRHVLAVDAFNDNREAGMQFGLKIRMEDGRFIQILSDTDWRVVPREVQGWEFMTEAQPDWGRAVKVSALLYRPKPEEWQERVPTMVVKVLVPPPAELRFWQAFWFQAGIWVMVGLVVLFCLRLMGRLAVQSKAQQLLRRERARIARDIHDELGARLTELALEGEVIQTELPAESSSRPKLEALCEKARAVSGAMDEVVWMVNSRRDTLRDFATYSCKHAQRFLAASPIRCRLDVDGDLPDLVFELPVRRSLLLGVKEALNNAAKYSGASELFLRIHRRGQTLFVEVEDNGMGFDLETASPERNGLFNMNERMREVGGRCRITTSVGSGCRVEFQVPLPKKAGLSDSSVPQDDPDLADLRRRAAVSSSAGKEASAQ